MKKNLIQNQIGQIHPANICKVLILLMLFLMPVASYSAPDTTKKDTGKKVAAQKTQGKVDTTDKAKKSGYDPGKIKPPASKYFYIGYVSICAISLIIALFLIYLAVKSPSDVQFPLGLPNGSIGAVIALLAIIFYILVSITLPIFDNSSQIATDVTKTLGTLVVAVSAFYFGSKTAENSSRQATANLTSFLNNSPSGNPDPSAVVPVAIIQQAIAANKSKWMALYNCTDIVPGKKESQDTIHNLDCIVFIVNTKDVPADTKSIPAFINYNSQGKTYSIPTDVQTVP